MSATFLQLKNYVGRFIGESDGSGTDSTRDSLINDALKEISARYPFKCNRKSASIALTNNAGNLPSDFDYAHKPIVYTYSGTTKYPYTLVDLDDLSAYSTGSYVCTLDYSNGQIKSSEADTLTLDYWAIPADMTTNTDTTKFPIPMAIARLAAGQYWLSIEEDPDQADRNFTIADSLINQAIGQDRIADPYRALGKNSHKVTNTGYQK